MDTQLPSEQINNPEVTPPHKSISHWIVVGIAVLVVVGYFTASAYYAMWPFGDLLKPLPDLVVCPQDAQVCPDGSSVGRTGPNCEFAKCPIEDESSAIPSDWKTYRNEEYGFEFKYPGDWVIYNTPDIIAALNSPENEEALKKINSGQMYGEGYGEDIEISLFDFEESTLEQYLSKKTEHLLIDVKKTTFAKKEAYEMVQGGFGAYYTILIKSGDNVIRIFFNNRDGKSKLNETENQILSTFRFTR